MRRALRVPGFILLAGFVVLAGAFAIQFLGPGLVEYNHIPAAAKSALDDADEFQLLSLSPEGQHSPAADDFHNYKVLGRTSVKDTETRRQLVSALKWGALWNQGEIAACFNPRHGIHVVHKGKQTDFVICFECLQVEVYGEGAGGFLVSESAKPLFDQVLRTAGVPLP